MSLATRCTSCGTVFRVVQDQLKVSEGWVRCGRCQAVFSALEGLFDLDREVPPEWGDRATVEAPQATSLPPAEPSTAGDAPLRAQGALAEIEGVPAHIEDRPSTVEVEDASPSDEGASLGADDAAVESNADDAQTLGEESTPSTRGELLADPIDAHLFGPRPRAESAPKPAGQVDARDRLEFSDARFDSDLFEENASAAASEVVETVADAGAQPLESTIRPEFIRRADRRARWQTSPLRGLLLAGCVTSALLLVLQAGHHFRDTAAARWPALRPVLTAWCRLADCALDAPRRIDDVQLESTALARAVGMDAFVLSVQMRNRGPFTLTLPSVDLILTDGNGRLVARRALSPRDFRASAVIPAGAEVPLQLTLATGKAQVAGYTVEIFYP
jgi:predicted Zn finger-like uncharacterized protein